MTETTNDTAATLRSYASMIDKNRIGMAYFLRKTADDIDEAINLLENGSAYNAAIKKLKGEE